MTRSTLAIAGAVFFGTLLVFFMALDTFATKLDSAAAAAPAARASPPHFASPRQLIAAGAMSRVPLVLGTATDHNGNAVHWSELAADRPLVVVFIKDGCPCGVEFEPFFHRLASAYQDVARFVGVIDADVAAARRYADMNHVPYLLLADPGREIIGRFQAENGAYVGLLAPGGVIEAVWPGCSAAMMRELSEQLARLGGVSQRTVELAGLPNALTAGCPFALTKE